MQKKSRASAWRQLLCAGLLWTATGSVFAQTPPANVDKAGEVAAEVFVQTGNSLQITMVRYAPDGQHIATCDAVGSVVAWDAASGRQFREVHKHTGMCLGLSFTPDSQMIVSSGGARSGNDVVMSRVADGKLVQSWQGHKGQVRDVVAAANAQGAWSLGERDGLMRWRLGAAAPVQKLSLLMPGETLMDAPFNASMVLTHDQQKAYVARTDGSVLLLDLANSTAAVLLAKFPETLSALALSPDGGLLALSRGNMMGSASQDVVLISTATGQEVKRLVGHAGNVFAVAFSPDGKLLASAAQIDTTAMLNGGMKAVSQHEALRLWRVQDGAVLADVRNQRNINGSPFLRGSLDFSPAVSPAPISASSPMRVALALWDEAARLYEVDPAQGLRLLYTLEGRGLSPRQIRVSDKTAQMMVSDGRPRIAPKYTYLKAPDVRREFGQDSDWTPERESRVGVLYAGLGFSSSVQRASMWDLKTGRLERVVDWQRGPTSDMGVDAQGRFTSVAPMFPHTIMVAPVKTRIVREASADAQGLLSFRHFGYEPWDGKPDDIFTALPASATGALTTGPASPVPVASDRPPHEGAYGTDLIIQSPSQRWTVVAGVPIEDSKAVPTSKLSPRVFIQQRLADGTQQSRYDIGVPGTVRAMVVSGDDRTLWVSGTAKSLPYQPDHQGWLWAIDLGDGKVTRQWELAQGVTVDLMVAHPDGNMAITNGGSNLSVWDTRQTARKYFVLASASLRPVKAIALTADGKTIAASDTAGWTVLWNWPEGSEPIPRWSRQLPSPSPHLLSFMASDQRIAAGSNDGSIRLLSSTDGGEIARMIRFDNDEWITIIPEGYFVASQEGDRWVNVRMGSKVYGIDQFYDVFYRPDIVERRLAGQPIAPLITVTLTDALRDPPPQVSLQLATNAISAGQKIRLDFEALTQGGGVGELRILHNGKLVEVLNRTVLLSGLASSTAASGVAASAVVSVQAQGALRGEETVTRALRLAVQAQQDSVVIAPPLQQLKSQVEVELIPGENSFSVIGFNTAGNLNARPVTRSVVAQGTAPAPRVFVLSVGVDIFKNPNSAPTLQFAVKDSSDFAAGLRQRLDSPGSAYRNSPVVMRMLQNEQATRSGLVQALDELQKEVRSNDLLIWFVASHGTLDNNAQYGIVLQDWDGKAIADSLFSTANILDASRRIKAFNQLVILDTCHAGGVSSLVRGLYDARLAVLARNMGLHVFASASATEEALDGYQGNGLFTHTLLKGLNTSLADKNADKQITVNKLGEFARRETMRIARLLHHNQEPLLLNFGKDVTVYAID